MDWEVKLSAGLIRRADTPARLGTISQAERLLSCRARADMVLSPDTDAAETGDIASWNIVL